MSALSGWQGRVAVGNVSIPVTRWNLSWKTDALDVTTMETGAGAAAGFLSSPVSAWQPGITDMDLSFDAVWDTTLEVIVASPPAIRAGNVVRIYLYMDVNANVGWSFTTVQLTEVNMDDEVRGIVKYTASGKVTSQPINTGALVIAAP